MSPALIYMNPLDFSSSLSATPTGMSDGTYGAGSTALADFNAAISSAPPATNPAANVPGQATSTPALTTSGWQTLNQTIGNLGSLAGNLVQAGQQLQQKGAALPVTTGVATGSPNTLAGGVSTKTILTAGAVIVALVVAVAIIKRH